MSLPPLHQLRHSPRLYVADGFATPAESAHVRRLGLDPAVAAAHALTAKRDATGFSFEMPVDGDPVLEDLRNRLHAVLGLVNVHDSTMRFRHYGPGETHPPHLDCYEIQGAHLVCTALVHLVDCEEGGETNFPRAYPTPASVRARRGRLVAWFNYYPNGAPDQSSFHEGAPVVRGEKTTVTAFIYAPLAAARVRPVATAGWREPA
ncbi:MAG: 2OG-Fe(II) oxygenase [Vicinamibacterales bacterium]